MASISKKNCFCDKNMIRVYTTELEQTLEHSWGTICFAKFSHRVYSIPTMAIRHPPHTYKKVVLFGTPCSVWDFSSRGPSTDPRELLPIRCHLLQAGFRVTLYSHLPAPLLLNSQSAPWEDTFLRGKERSLLEWCAL